MTPSDRASLAKIASYGFFQGQSESEIEARLHQYVSGLSQAEIDRAIAEGRLGQERAATMMREGEAGAVVALTRQAGQDVRGYDLSVRFRIGPNEETDWRQITLPIPVGSTRERVRSLIRAAIGARLSGESGAVGGVGYRGAQLVVGTENIVYAVPTFAEG